MSKYTIELTEIQEKVLTELGIKLNKVEKEVEKDTFPNNRDKYYYLTAYGAIEKVGMFDSDNSFDIYRRSIGNAFRTEEEAEFMVERLEVIAELKRYAKGYKFIPGQYNWDINYTTANTDENIYIAYAISVVEPNIYFATEEDAQAAIDAIGEDRLKKYYFMMED